MSRGRTVPGLAAARCSASARRAFSAPRVVSSRWVFSAVVTVAVAALLCGTRAAGARERTKTADIFWVHPNFDSVNVQSVAVLPASSFDKNQRNETTVENLFAKALQPSGYRWTSARVAKEMIRSTGGDSALRALHGGVLDQGRVDSLAAPRICRGLRAGAVMSVRVDLFEQVQVEWNQSGKPTTTVRLRAALVDSVGRLLWSASGSETGEGPYHEADAGTVGVKGSGLNTTPITAQGGAPSFEEVTSRLFTRWMQRFPARKPGVPAAPKP